MDWMYLVYFLLGAMLFFGARPAGRKAWNEEYTSLGDTRMLKGIMALFIALHHMGQKTGASWQPAQYRVHGLDVFIPLGYLFVGVFFFCSGLGLYRSLHAKPDYLKGFFRRRVLPVVVAFYLSEIIFTAVRLAMGEKMDAAEVLWYLSGLHMANPNAWYAIVIPFFYAVFWAAFRFCRREGTAVALVFLFTLGYTALGAAVGPQNDGWMRGEWWVNSVILFPLGLLFGMHERRVTAALKKGYVFWLILFMAGAVLLFRQSEWFNLHIWSYGGVRGPTAMPRRLACVGFQWLAAFFFTGFCFILTMKVRLGNRALGFLGGITLEFYLLHGMFVELFGFNFLNIARSLLYIRNLPLYTAAVLICSVCAALLFRRIRGGAEQLLLRNRKGSEAAGKTARKEISEKPAGKQKMILRLAIWAAAFLLLAFLILPMLQGNENVRVMNGLEFQIPAGYSRTYADGRYGIWEYKKTDRKPGNLILDGNIQDRIARFSRTAEDVLTEYDWLQEKEMYVNPQGVRMVRGYAELSGTRERRYYIEGPENLVLMCMTENERFYSIGDCEQMLQEAADSVRRIR